MRRPRGSLVLITIGATLAPAFTSLGVLAAPLAILRGLMEPGSSRLKRLFLVVAAMGGLAAYVGICKLAGTDILATARQNNGHKTDALAGLAYSVSVPGRLLWPVTAGVPASWAVKAVPAWAGWVAGLLALLGTITLAVWRSAAWNRRLMLIGAAMIYFGYLLTYTARAGLVRQGLWTEAQLLYVFATRYHVLPVVGASAIIAALLASWPLIQRCDRRHRRCFLVATVIGLVALLVERQEVASWAWMLRDHGQKETLELLHKVGRIARSERISREQLVRIVGPVFRTWNSSVDGPSAFALTQLMTEAPEQVGRALTDETARACLKGRLTQEERLLLGSGTCVSLNPARPGPGAQTLAVAQRVKIRGAREQKPGEYRLRQWPAYIEFAFDSKLNGRYLVFPDLHADQDLVVLWCDDSGRWRPGQNVRWLRSPETGTPVVIDLERLIHWQGGPLSRVRVRFTRTGQVALREPPRLVRENEQAREDVEDLMMRPSDPVGSGRLVLRASGVHSQAGQAVPDQCLPPGITDMGLGAFEVSPRVLRVPVVREEDSHVKLGIPAPLGGDALNDLVHGLDVDRRPVLGFERGVKDFPDLGRFGPLVLVLAGEHPVKLFTRVRVTQIVGGHEHGIAKLT